MGHKSIFNLVIIMSVFTLSVWASTLCANASETNGAILPSSTYAWGENLGWINFKPANGGLLITDSNITGYAWSQNSGWINFSPQGGGVTNSTGGQLGGHAWSQNSGWIDFSGVRISSLGKFTGIAGAINTLSGRINFDCTHCDVRTDWRPLSARTVPLSSGSILGSSAAAALPSSVPLVAISENTPLLVTPESAARSTQSTKDGPVVVEIPKGAHSNPFTLSINVVATHETQSNPPAPLAFVLNAAFYDIKAIDSAGNEIHQFNTPITITLPLPPSMQQIRRLAVYWLDPKQNSWELIPNALFARDHVTFSVMHLSRFAIFAMRTGAIIQNPTLVQSPKGGAIIVDKGTIDMSKQNVTIAAQLGAVSKTTPERNVTPPTQTRQTTGMVDMPTLTIITLLTATAYILARRRLP